MVILLPTLPSLSPCRYTHTDFDNIFQHIVNYDVQQHHHQAPLTPTPPHCSGLLTPPPPDGQSGVPGAEEVDLGSCKGISRSGGDGAPGHETPDSRHLTRIHAILTPMKAISTPIRAISTRVNAIVTPISAIVGLGGGLHEASAEESHHHGVQRYQGQARAGSYVIT